jgi:antitoxin component YwqK of YwqJK toxin-antitoxin module
MRYLLGLFFSLFFLFECQAQTDTTFVNELGTYVSREQANYYRLIIATEKNTYLFNDYYFNHLLAKSIEYKGLSGTTKEGKAVVYNQKRNKISEGNYHNGFQIGEWQFYFMNDSIKEKKTFNEKLHAYYSYQYDSTTSKLEEEGAFDHFEKKTGDWKRYFWNTKILQSTNHYLVGKKEGAQLEYYKSGAIKRKEIFEKYILPMLAMNDKFLLTGSLSLKLLGFEPIDEIGDFDLGLLSKFTEDDYHNLKSFFNYIK